MAERRASAHDANGDASYENPAFLKGWVDLEALAESPPA